MQNTARPQPGPAQPATDTSGYQITYPEIYYKVQPLVLLACDQLNIRDAVVDQATVSTITETIYHDLRQLYPEIAAYTESPDPKPNEQALPLQFGWDRRRGTGRFRRGGLLRDLIEIMFLRELFSRGGLWF